MTRPIIVKPVPEYQPRSRNWTISPAEFARVKSEELGLLRDNRTPRRRVQCRLGGHPIEASQPRWYFKIHDEATGWVWRQGFVCQSCKAASEAA